LVIKTIRATIPGILYRRASPDQPFFKTEGDKIAVGETVALIEVMKTFSNVTAEEAGTLVRFLIEDEVMVMPDDPIYEMEV
jgi:acetyl-CoA carboxylase biotin carboxyl carrier protein